MENNFINIFNYVKMNEVIRSKINESIFMRLINFISNSGILKIMLVNFLYKSI